MASKCRILCLGNVEYSAQLVTALPVLFPRVRCLELRGACEGSSYQHGGQTDKLVLGAVATNWRNMESIVDSSYPMSVTLQMLEVTTFDNLTSSDLNLYCEITINSQQLYSTTMALIQVIHNVPLFT